MSRRNEKRSRSRSTSHQSRSLDQRLPCHFEKLEDRRLLVVGAFEVPAAIAPGGQFDGVVALERTNSFEFCSATLLTTGRHLISAAHCFDGDNDGTIDPGNNFQARFDLPTGSIVMPFSSADIQLADPAGWNGSTSNGSDAVVIELTAIAPWGNGTNGLGFDIYTNNDENGKATTAVGFGLTGTGSTGKNDGNSEIQRLDMRGGTQGDVRLSLNGQTSDVPFNANAAQIKAALEGMLNASVGGVNLVNTFLVNMPGNPNNGVFEFDFESVNGNGGVDVGQVGVQALNAFDGNLTVQTLIDGGDPEDKRAATNVFNEFPAEPTIFGALFDSVAGEGVLAPGDSGGPAFINNEGTLEIAGLSSYSFTPGGNWGDRAYQHTTYWARVSQMAGDINAILTAAPYDLVLDMRYQVEGLNADADAIIARRNGADLEILIDGVLVFSDAVANVSTLEILGFDDDETITIDDLQNVTTVDAKAGSDAVELVNGANVTGDVETGSGNDGVTLWDTSQVDGDILTDSGSDNVNLHDASVIGGDVFLGGSDSPGDVNIVTFDGGRINGRLVGGLGINQLDFSLVASQMATLTALGGDGGFDGVLASNLIGGGFENVDEVSGSTAGGSDHIRGLDLISTWTLNNSDAEYVASGRSLMLHNFESFAGGSAVDTFNVASNDQLRSIDGGGESDVLNNATGGSGTFVVNGGNSGSFNTLLSFASIESLVGNVVDDEFRFMNSGFLSGTIAGGLGVDHFNYAAMASQIINLTGVNANGFAGNVNLGNLVAGGFQGINEISGSLIGAADQLNGLNAISDWVINNAMGSYSTGAFLLDLTDFETYHGGSQDDSFSVLATDREVHLNGNDGVDTFVLASTAPSPVGGNVSGINGVVNVHGGSGASTLVVSDFSGSDNSDVRITDDTITGLAPADIHFLGSFPGNGIAGVTLWGADNVADLFTVDSFLAMNTLEILTFGGDDRMVTTVDALGDMRLDGQEGSDVIEIAFIHDTRRVDAQDSGISGTDRLSLYGLPDPDSIVVRPTSVARNVTDRVWHDANTEYLEVMSRAGEDVFNIAGSDAHNVLMQAGNGDDYARIIGTGNAGRMEFLGGRDNDRIHVRETSMGTMTIVNGQHDTDKIFVGSNLSENDGSLDRIQGPLAVVGGNQAAGAEDRLYVNDRATMMGQIYKITDSEISSVSPRTFTSMSVHQFEVIRLDGTDQADEFQVTPSYDVRFVVDGNLPTRHEIACADEGDFLNLVAEPNSGRRLYLTDRTNGNGTWGFSSGFQTVNFTSIEKFNHVERLALGSDAFLTGHVNVLDAETRESLFTLQPYEDWFTGGVRVATGDVTNDGIPDIIVAPGAGRSPLVKVYDGVNGHQVTSFMAYGSNQKDGVLLAVGDVGGDCGAEIVTSLGPGRGNAEIRVWRPGGSGQYQMVDHFFPFGTQFQGGASVAVGDFDGDGTGDIVTGALHGQANVAIFKGGVPGGGFELSRFMAFQPQFYGGVHVATGDLIGDGTPELMVSTGHNQWGSYFNSQVHVFDGSALPYTPFQFASPDFAFQAFGDGENPQSSTRLVGKDHDLDGVIDELFASHGPGDNDSTVKVFDPASQSLIDTLFESDSAFDHGVFVG